ncbi:MAG: hypothetical protein H6744_15465 [Deltaproteobacteria bacterium]|nr:hypothetical protein [Deltaproteobacteria bacterium]MCB9788080.1 hypothetical protein [Deltaproteobacteria bacterium]
MGRILPVILAVVALLGGCADKVKILNVVPRLTWVAVSPAADGVVEITLWVSDRDGDPVDVDGRWTAEPASPGDAGEPLVMAAGGHGLIGLTTDDGIFDPNGEAHLVRWDVSAVDATGDIRLRFAPDDLEAGPGTPMRTPAFSLGVGLPEPVPLEVDPDAVPPNA